MVKQGKKRVRRGTRGSLEPLSYRFHTDDNKRFAQWRKAVGMSQARAFSHLLKHGEQWGAGWSMLEDGTFAGVPALEAELRAILDAELRLRIMLASFARRAADAAAPSKEDRAAFEDVLRAEGRGGYDADGRRVVDAGGNLLPGEHSGASKG